MRLPINKFHLYWLGVWFFIFFYVVYADGVLSNEVSYKKRFYKNQYAISYIFPLGRTEVYDTHQTVIEEPVYITVYAPRLYDKAELRLRFDVSPIGWSIGVQTAPGFSYELTPLLSEREQMISLNISESITEKNRLRFIFAHNGAIETPISLESISVTLSQPRNPYSKELVITLKKIYERATTIL